MIFIDTCFMIYMFSDKPEDADRRKKCHSYLEKQRTAGRKIITSTVALSEVVVPMEKEHRARHIARIRKSGISVLPYGVAESLAIDFDKDFMKCEGINRIKFKVDIMLFASAVVNKCNEIASNDKDIIGLSNKYNKDNPTKPHIKITTIDSLALSDKSGQIEIAL